MSILLNGINLTGLIRSDLFNTNLQGFTQTALDGSLILFEQPILYNDFHLIGGSDWGWLSLGTLKSLHSMARTPYSLFTLDYEGSLYTVRFKSEDIPVISGEPLIKRSNPSDGDFYNNILIKLMEV